MKKLEPRDLKNIDIVKEIIDRICSSWEDESNIVNIGPGIKITDGKPIVDTLCIQFFVNRKVDTAECKARNWKIIPDEIDGIPTDVEPTLKKPLQVLETRSQRFDPLVGGVIIGNQNLSSVGTLGGFVFRNADGAVQGLTNEHVLVFTNQGVAGDPVVQPSRDYDSEVGIVDASCCPDGQLSFDSVPNPLAGALAATAVVAAIAAAASDVIDPHRRGQENTNVDPGERTLKEHVHMKIDYQEMPLPGIPYSTEVNYDYSRHTNKGIHSFSHKEKLANPHVLGEQELITNKATYTQGNQVYFLAAISGLDRDEECPERHVVAHAVSPLSESLKSTILKPLNPIDMKYLSRIFSDVDLNKPLLPQYLYFGDYAWQNLPPAGIPWFKHRGFRVTGINGNLLRFSDTLPRPTQDGIGELTIPNDGVEIQLPIGSEGVFAWVYGQHSEPITMEAFDGDKKVGTHSGAGQGVPALLQVLAPRITRITITGGGAEGLLMLFASARKLEGNVCYYWGKTQLEPTAELGLWSTYLMVQTVNDVPAGTDPARAAQTIGGLVSSSNLVSGGRRSQLPFGEFCAIDAIPNGNFKVVPPS